MPKQTRIPEGLLCYEDLLEENVRRFSLWVCDPLLSRGAAEWVGCQCMGGLPACQCDATQLCCQLYTCTPVPGQRSESALIIDAWHRTALHFAQCSICFDGEVKRNPALLFRCLPAPGGRPCRLQLGSDR